MGLNALPSSMSSVREWSKAPLKLISVKFTQEKEKVFCFLAQFGKLCVLYDAIEVFVAASNIFVLSD